MRKTLLAKVNGIPILRSSLAIALITILAKVIGYAEKIILAYYYGTSYKVDVYNVVIAIVLSVFIFFRELIEPGFLNTFLKAKHAKDEKNAWGLFNYFAKYIILITLILSLFVYVLPSAVVHFFAPGFAQEKSRLLIRLIQLAFPACIFLSLSALTNITLNALKKFALPASGELAFKIVILLTLVALNRYWGIFAVVLGVFAGAVAKLLVHLSGLFKYLSLKRNSTRNLNLSETWKLTWPLFIGVSFSQLSSLVDNVFASYLQEGSISALSYSKKIIELPILVFPYILSVVVFPYFTELSINQQKERLAGLLSQTLSWIMLVFLPLSVFFCLFSHEIVEVIFKRGAFDEHSTVLTAYPLAFYSTGMVFFAIETVLVVFFYSNADTRSPTAIGVLCVIENIVLAYILIRGIGYVGIALALVISKATKVVVLFFLLKKHIRINFDAAGSFVVKLILSCVVFMLALFVSKAMLGNFSRGGAVAKALFLIVTFLFATAAYIITLLLLKFNKRSIVSKPNL